MLAIFYLSVLMFGYCFLPLLPFITHVKLFFIIDVSFHFSNLNFTPLFSANVSSLIKSLCIISLSLLVFATLSRLMEFADKPNVYYLSQITHDTFM